MNSLIEVTQTVLFTPARLLAQVEYSTEGTAPSPISTIIGLLIALVVIVAMWKVFTKAGQPGWASIIPIYNLYIWCKIVGRPWWWILLMLIPFVNFIVAIILCIDLAKSFGKGGLRNRPCFVGNYFLPDSRLRQCAISRTLGWGFGAENGAAGRVTDFAKARSCVRCPTEKGGTCCPQHVDRARRQSIEDNRFHLLRLTLSCCYCVQLGLRFSLNAAMPSRASSDSRACM
jgi:hypothetical protein